jgi:glutamate formiminotransferase
VPTTLLSVPNVSEGRDPQVVAAIGDAYAAAGVRLLDTHIDPDHHRSVHTLAGAPGELADGVLGGAREAMGRIDLTADRGLHPLVGALDVAPVVYLDERDRGAAAAEALVLAELLGDDLGVPVYLYGDLAGGRTRAELRSPGALDALAPDFGPRRRDPRRGATLVAVRPPLVAFNLEIEGTEEDAKRIAALIRESGAEGLPGVRALGLWLPIAKVAQVTTNVEDHHATALADLLAAVERHATVTEAEQVGLAPAHAYRGWPERVKVRGRRTIEHALS